MSGPSLSRVLIPAALVVVTGGLVALGLQFRATDAAAMANDRGTEEVVIPSAPPVSQPADAKTDAFDRPMFHRNRAPGPDKAPALPAETAPDPQATDEPGANAQSFVLKGIIIGERGARASIATADAPAGVWVKVGDDLQGWTIASIGASRVKIRNGDDVADIKFPDDRK
jgi:hypothetical protein